MKWTKKEVATLMRMREHGHRYREISKKLGRSEKAVTLKYHKVKGAELPEPPAEVQLELPWKDPVIWLEPADQYEDRINSKVDIEVFNEPEDEPYLRYHYMLAGLIMGLVLSAVLYSL